MRTVDFDKAKPVFAPSMNAGYVLLLLDGEPTALKKLAETLEAKLWYLVDQGTPYVLRTVRRAIRHLREGGLAKYRRRKWRGKGPGWVVTAKGKRARTGGV